MVCKRGGLHLAVAIVCVGEKNGSPLGERCVVSWDFNANVVCQHKASLLSVIDVGNIPA